MAKMTTQAKLDAAIAAVAKYTAALAAEAIRNNIEPGDVVTFSHGRKDGKVELQGTVVGVRSDTNGTWVAVTVGEGFELETYKIRAAAISANPAADVRNSDAQPAAAADADPLEAE